LEGTVLLLFVVLDNVVASRTLGIFALTKTIIRDSSVATKRISRDSVTTKKIIIPGECHNQKRDSVTTNTGNHQGECHYQRSGAVSPLKGIN
jgi:hypothetical protein